MGYVYPNFVFYSFARKHYDMRIVFSVPEKTKDLKDLKDQRANANMTLPYILSAF